MDNGDKNKNKNNNSAVCILQFSPSCSSIALTLKDTGQVLVHLGLFGKCISLSCKCPREQLTNRPWMLTQNIAVWRFKKINKIYCVFLNQCAFHFPWLQFESFKFKTKNEDDVHQFGQKAGLGLIWKAQSPSTADWLHKWPQFFGLQIYTLLPFIVYDSFKFLLILRNFHREGDVCVCERGW